MSHEQNNTAAASHNLSLEGRSKLHISGVQDVSGFDENTVILTTSQGNLCVMGEQLHIDRIDLDAGQLLLTGHVQQLRYDEKEQSHSLWSKLFG